MKNKGINNTNQNLKIRKRDYLTTEKINLGNFSVNKISDDLKSLEVAEKENIKTPLVSKNPQIIEDSKEMLALKLANPFRGY